MFLYKGWNTLTQERGNLCKCYIQQRKKYLNVHYSMQNNKTKTLCDTEFKWYFFNNSDYFTNLKKYLTNKSIA